MDNNYDWQLHKGILLKPLEKMCTYLSHHNQVLEQLEIARLLGQMRWSSYLAKRANEVFRLPGPVVMFQKEGMGFPLGFSKQDYQAWKSEPVIPSHKFDHHCIELDGECCDR